jgi:hypothetical protein
MGSLTVRIQQLSSLDEPLNPIEKLESNQHLILVFGSTAHFENPQLTSQLRQSYPDAVIAGCSTAGEITPDGVEDDTVTITSLGFKSTQVRSARVHLDDMTDSETMGRELASTLAADDLAYLMVLSDGLAVNGSSLVKGIRETLPEGVPFSGGLAGDAARFQKTLTLDNDGIHEKSIVAIGFYGEKLLVSHGSVGGWVPFGPTRRVTKSTANTVYEIDCRRALDIYSTYLGDEAQNLPASGLLFPLALSTQDGDSGVIRTLLAIDKEEGSLTFAGDIPEGAEVRLMHANYDQLVAGAELAADDCHPNPKQEADFALLISCVGRKLLLGTNTELEVDAVVDKFGGDLACTGFYSYGEISPSNLTGKCELHNQTMTITSLSEAA